MTIVITCTYRAGGADARLAIRDRHLEYIIANLADIRYAGALASEDDREATGMLIAHAAEDIETAQRFMEQEPYRSHGFFTDIRYARLRQFIPHPTTPDFLQEELGRERLRLIDEKAMHEDRP